LTLALTTFHPSMALKADSLVSRLGCYTVIWDTIRNGSSV
jgi:hypothetical protein